MTEFQDLRRRGCWQCGASAFLSLYSASHGGSLQPASPDEGANGEMYDGVMKTASRLIQLVHSDAWAIRLGYWARSATLGSRMYGIESKVLESADQGPWEILPYICKIRFLIRLDFDTWEVCHLVVKERKCGRKTSFCCGVS